MFLLVQTSRQPSAPRRAERRGGKGGRGGRGGRGGGRHSSRRGGEEAPAKSRLNH